MKQILSVLILLHSPLVFGTQILPAKIFSDDMVLQREINIPVWGTALPGEVIEVILGDYALKTTTRLNGKWKIHLPELPAGGPFEMYINGSSDSVIYRNVLIGDVWFASGQSNMEHPMKGWEWIPHSSINSIDEEIADSNYPQIRLFSVPKYPAPVELSDLLDGEWKIANSETVSGFSSVAWFYAKELHQKLDVPIGIINSSWGGTPIQTWMSREMLEPYKDSLKLPEIPENFNPSEWSDKVVESIEKNRKRRNQISYPFDDIPTKVSKLTFDDSSWEQVDLLDSSNRFNNIVWLRKTIKISKEEFRKPLNLSLGFLNRQSNIYWNGVELGYFQYPKLIELEIPSNLVDSGKNILTIRIAQPWGRSQTLGEPSQFYISNKEGAFYLSLNKNWQANDQLESINPAVKSYQNNPAFLFNGMIAPIIPYGLKGFIWYQGESDAGHPILYEKMFQQFIIGLRNLWQNQFPFLFVQLSNIELSHHFEENSETWCKLREAQKKALYLPKTGMVVSLDIGDPYDVHPHNKQEFGYRLALQALNIAYHQPFTADAPTPESVEQTGDTLIIHFSSDIYISEQNSNEIFCSLELLNNDGIFKPEKAFVKNDQLIIISKKDKKPVAVRYAWKNNPSCCLFSKEKIPIEAFWLKIKNGNSKYLCN